MIFKLSRSCLRDFVNRTEKIRPIEVCYEAGPCGLVIARRLRQAQVPC